MAISTVSLLTACGSAESVPENESNTNQQASVSKKITTQDFSNVQTDNYVSPLPDGAPVYTVAMTGTTPPFSYQNDYGVMMGIDVDVIRAIGEEQGFKVKFHKAFSWSDMLESTETDKTDLAMSGISYRDERAEKYSLSEAYFFNPAAIAYIDPKVKVKSLNELEGQRIAAIKNSTSVEFAESVKNAKVSLVDTPYLAYENLIQNNVDATVYDLPVWKHYAKQIPEYDVSIEAIEDKSNKGSYAVIMASKNNAQLIETVNEGLEKIKAQGKVEEIRHKWLDIEDH